MSAVFSSLESEFLVLPKGQGFIDYPIFEQGYETLKRTTHGFHDMPCQAVTEAALQSPMILIVLRTMLGFTPSELAYIASQRSGVEVSQGFARSLDRKIRQTPSLPLRGTDVTKQRVAAMVDTACRLLSSPPSEVEPDQIHRLDKADTRGGLQTVALMSDIGVPYAMLLYERFLGRPFAGHRDSVSELVGDALESAVEDALSLAHISYRKTKRAETLPGFDQAPDFVIPSEFNPQVVIEAKLTEDDGTARDKVTRIQHLGEISMAGRPPDSPKFEVVACIAGRGFGVRREDMK
ncbi:MAG TPA: hypothetical protein PLJ35_03020 [Anaerolineae bacterium]|nr:hypothetical protein [Anaerolineae bacterium]HOQ97773.1 hypothetical protein [Anaerolineae bacterium]HPL29533.1 hypothetical protein [Anaerolineae bacterium]